MDCKYVVRTATSGPKLDRSRRERMSVLLPEAAPEMVVLEARVVTKTIKVPLVCWPSMERRGYIDDAKIIEPGELISVAKQRLQDGHGRMAVEVNHQTFYCDCDQLRKSVW